MNYIATFYSHFGAIRFKKICDSHHCPAKIMPVPRTLSSSCGTCVGFECDAPILSVDSIQGTGGTGALPFDSIPDEVEQIVSVENGQYTQIYRAENS